MLIAIFCEKTRNYQALIKQALETGYNIALLTQDPEKIKINHEHLQVFKGDIEDEAAVNNTLEHANAVVGLFVRRTPQGISNIITTMQRYDVRRCIFFSEEVESYEGRTLSNSNAFKRTIASLITHKEPSSLDIIRKSDRDWTILQAFDSPNTPSEHVDLSGDSYAKVEDNFAKFMIGQIADATNISRILSI